MGRSGLLILGVRASRRHGKGRRCRRPAHAGGTSAPASRRRAPTDTGRDETAPVQAPAPGDDRPVLVSTTLEYQWIFRVPVVLDRAPADRAHRTEREHAFEALELRNAGLARQADEALGRPRVQLQVSGPDPAQRLPHGVARCLRRRAGAGERARQCRRRRAAVRYDRTIHRRSKFRAGPGPTRAFVSAFRRVCSAGNRSSGCGSR